MENNDNVEVTETTVEETETHVTPAHEIHREEHRTTGEPKVEEVTTTTTTTEEKSTDD